MAIMSNDNQRIDQYGGLSPDFGAFIPSPMIIKNVDEDVLRLKLIMLGGSPAIRGITQRVFHKHSMVINEIVNRAIPTVRQLGGTPCTLTIGIGRSQFKANSLIMQAMVKGYFGIQSNFKKQITDKVNEEQTGPLGLDGKHSVFGSPCKDWASTGKRYNNSRYASMLLL